MMTLRVMRLITDTLDKSGRCAIADQLAALWGAEDARFFRASANFIFQCERDGKPYMLRFNHESERTYKQLDSELDALTDLAMKGLRIAWAIPTNSAILVNSLSTPHGYFYATMIERLPGEHLDFDDLTPDQFRQWGQKLAQVHNAATDVRRASRPTWRHHINVIEVNLPARETAAHAALACVKDQLNALPITRTNFGFIHFDFELDNLLWHEGEIDVIDFDDSAFYWFAADIAFALRDLFNDDPHQVDLTHSTLLSFLEGYRSVRAMPDEETAHLPLFLRLHNLLLFTRIIRSLGTDAPPDDPDWMKALRTRFHNMLDQYRANFETWGDGAV